MKNIVLFIVFSFYFSANILAQSQVVFTNEQSQSFVIEHTAGLSPVTDAIIGKLAQGNSVPASSLEIIFSFTEKLKITKRDQTYTLSATLANFKFEGKKNYKGFSAESYLMPGNLNFKLKWFRGSQELTNYTFTNVKMEGESVEIARVNEVDTFAIRNAPGTRTLAPMVGTGSNYKIVCSDMVFTYTQEDKKAFEAFTVQVDEYITKSNDTKQQARLLDGIDSREDFLKRLDNLNILYDYRDKASKALDFVQAVKAKDFYKNLPLDRIDPENILAQLESIENQANAIYTSCDNIIRNLDVVYLERGMDMLGARQPERADMFFNKAIEVNPTFAPAHFQLARLYYNGGMVDRAVQKLFEIQNMTPDMQTKMQADELMQGIYNEMLLDAGGLNSDGRYDEALAVLSRAREICQNWRAVPCRANMDDETARALNGKYDNILREADRAFSENKLKNAEDLIQSALAFKNSNRTFIPDDKRMTDRINNLYFKYLDLGDADLNAKKFQNAIGYYEQAGRVCSEYKEISCTDDLDKGLFHARTGVYGDLMTDADRSYYAKDYAKAEKQLTEAAAYRQTYKLEKNANEDALFIKIKQAVYDDYIAKGRNSSTSKKYGDALSYYDYARTIETNYSIKRNSALGGYITTAAQEFSLQLVADGLKFVDSNNLTQARSKYSQARDNASKYGLEGNKTLEREFAKLKDKIFAQECLNAQNEYDRLMREAVSKINTKAYPEADKLLVQAQNHAVDNADCEIDARSAKDKQKEIAQAANYMNQITAVDNQLNSRNYRPAIEMYITANDYFTRNNVARFGLKCDDLYTFITTKNSDFINYASSYYIETKQYDKSLSLMKLLPAKGYDKNYTKVNQTQLATALAQRDYSQNPSGDYKSAILGYVGEDKFFKKFTKSYKKAWKNLD